MSERLAAAARGWKLFPVYGIRPDGRCTCPDPGGKNCTPGKHPLWRAWPEQATSDLATIRTWSERLNTGVATGERSGIVVLDIDPDKGGDDSLATLEARYGRLPATVECLTGGGGRHLYFQQPGRYVKSTSGVIAPGVDVRGDGGFVILAGSRHASGRLYQWEASGHPADVPVAELPGAWAELLTSAGRERRAAHTDGAPIPEGRRNATLASMAGGMRYHGFDEAAILAALDVTNAAYCDPPLDPDEVAQIAASIARYPAGERVPPRIVITEKRAPGPFEYLHGRMVQR